MNVLSLFDGMSCGQIALDNLGIKVDNYFSSEIDKYAMQVAKKNYPNTQHIGDVTKVKAEELPKIDLLIGGSPCQSFSSAGNGKGFDGSSGLFYEWVRLLKECKPKYFLLENVVMKKEWAQGITDIIGVEPVMVDSKNFVAQNRKRMYWTNIPMQPIVNMNTDTLLEILECDVTSPNSSFLTNSVTAEEFLKNKEGVTFTQNFSKGSQSLKRMTKNIKALNQKANCMTATFYKGMAQNGCTNIVVDGVVRKLTPLECERLQGVSDNYTDCASNTQRYKMLGNGWTVPVIEHIFKGLI